MLWVLSKAPVAYHGTTLTEDDLGAIKIALASCATTTMDYYGRTHSSGYGKNIYDQALDRVIAMEEKGTPYDLLCLDDDQMNLVTGGVGTFNDLSLPQTGWLTSLLHNLFLWT